MTDALTRLAAALSDRYRVERELGEGGMATVYLADDLKHDRQVAIKVLKPELAAVLGADRFVQEIKTTAALQHPNILPLFDSGSADGFLYYVMPYVEGESLRKKLDRETQLGVEEAVKITGEVADALQYAHEQGVVHRDIKPENILLHAGRPMVADFGIALAVSAAAGGRMTETGITLGTPQYMSPEQATATKRITTRSDIYSLGSVLYEMLAGEPPYVGPTAQAVISKILVDPLRPVNELRKSVPPNVSAAVAKALEKVPADRFETAKAFGEALHGASPATPLGRVAPPYRRRAFAAVLPSAVALAAMALAAWGWLRPIRKPVVTRYQATLGTSSTPDGITFRLEVALSPDGASLVFRDSSSGTAQLYIKRRDELIAQPLAGTEGGSGPFFSPDGAFIGFFAHGELRRIPSTGGSVLTLADHVNPNYNSGAWLQDGSIFYVDVGTHSVRRLAAGETTPRTIASPAMFGPRAPWLPTPLPSSRGILFTAHLTECVGPVSCRPSRVYLYDARRDTVRALFDDAVGAWYVPTGHVVYLTSSGTLMAVPWDNDALVPTGRPVPIFDGIQAPGLVLSDEGTALYVVGPTEFAPGPVPNAALVWVDRSGHVEPVDPAWHVNTGGFYGGPGSWEAGWGLALSPDGHRIALTLLTELGTNIWVKQLPAGPVSRLTLDTGTDRSPAWTRDGRAITFLSDRPIPPETTSRAHRFSLWEKAVNGTAEPRLLWPRDAPTEGRLSPDGRWIVLAAVASGAGAPSSDILAARSGVDSVARAVAATAYAEQGPAISPDSHWLAYVSDEQGEPEVFVRPFPPNVNDDKWHVSSGRVNSAPVWSHDGRELFFISRRVMNVVTIHPGPPFSADPPRTLFRIPDRVRAGNLAAGTFAVTPDDRRFLMVRDNDWVEMAGKPKVVVVENFFRELQEKMKR